MIYILYKNIFNHHVILLTFIHITQIHLTHIIFWKLFSQRTLSTDCLTSFLLFLDKIAASLVLYLLQIMAQLAAYRYPTAFAPFVTALLPYSGWVPGLPIQWPGRILAENQIIIGETSTVSLCCQLFDSKYH